MAATLTIPVGVVIERAKAASPWIDHTWRASAVLPGAPQVAPWSVLGGDDARATLYAGPADVVLHESDTASYRDNLGSGAPLLWVVLRPTHAEPPYTIVCVTADGSEGEGFTSAGDDLVDSVPMPDVVREAVATFVERHHVETPFYKRKRST